MDQFWGGESFPNRPKKSPNKSVFRLGNIGFMEQILIPGARSVVFFHTECAAKMGQVSSEEAGAR